jgi:hypothetical protein
MPSVVMLSVVVLSVVMLSVVMLRVVVPSAVAADWPYQPKGEALSPSPSTERDKKGSPYIA